MMGNLQKCSLFIHQATVGHECWCTIQSFSTCPGSNTHKQRIKKKQLYKLFSLQNVDNY